MDVDPDNNTRIDFDIPMADASASVTIASTVTPYTADHAENKDEGMDGKATIAMSIMTPLDWKNEGNGFVDRKDWDKALRSYRSGLSTLLKSSHTSDDNRDIASTDIALSSTTNTSLEVALRSNIAFVLLKMRRFQLAKEECNHILSTSPSNSKGE